MRRACRALLWLAVLTGCSPVPERDDGAILRNNGFWLAPGHNSIVRDAEGTDWILYHAIDAARAHFEDIPRRRGIARVMLLDRIIYKDGWPRIAGDQPSTGPQKAPVLP